MKTKINLVVMAMVAVLLTGIPVTSEAVTYHHGAGTTTVSTVRGVHDQVEVQPQQMSRTKSVKNLQVEQQTVADFTYGTKANYNVVGHLRNPAATVATIDRFTGDVCQYTLETREDYYEFFRFYLNSGMILISDSPKSVTGFKEAIRTVWNLHKQSGADEYVVVSEPLTLEDLSEEETSVVRGFITGEKWTVIAVGLEFDVQTKHNGNYGPVQQQLPAQIKVNDGRSGFEKGLDMLEKGFSIWNTIDNLRHRDY